MTGPTYMLDSEVDELRFIAKGSDLMARFLAEHQSLREIASCASAIEQLQHELGLIDDQRRPINDTHERRENLAAERRRLRRAIEAWAPSYTCPDCFGTRRLANGAHCPHCARI